MSDPVAMPAAGQVRLLFDEMLSPEIAAPLRAAGCNVFVVVEHADVRRASDADVLELASAQARVLVTLNIADFALLDQRRAAEGRRHAGLLYVSGKKFPASRAQVSVIAGALMSRHARNDWPGPGLSEFL